MAFDFKKLNFFPKLNARARILVIALSVVGLVLLVYLGTKWLSGSSEGAIGPSSVATPPSTLQSVPGGTGLSAQYQQALQQANAQSAESARMTGGSALPTLINPGSSPNVSGNQCIICSDQSANVKNILDTLTRSGKLNRDVADELQKLADQNVSPDEYAARLQQLVKDGKLTPEQARALLEEYKKQHANALLQDSSKVMDDLIKSGSLPLDVANQLLDAQKKDASPADYAAMLQKQVAEGKISQATADALLKQYTGQYQKQVTAQSIAILQSWASAGQMTQDVEDELVKLENQTVPLDVVDQTLKKFVADNKLTPAVADKIRAEYIKQKAMMGPVKTNINDMIGGAEKEAYDELNELLSTGKITQDTANQIRGMIVSNPSMDVFQAAIVQMVDQKKLTPDIAKLKIGDYQKIKDLRNLSQNLDNLQANNATANQYANMLKQAVAAGILTPEQAAKLMTDYRAVHGETAQAVGISPVAEFATGVVQAAGGESGQARIRRPSQESDEEQSTRLQNLVGAMTGQAGQLIAAWQPSVMAHVQGAPAVVHTDGKGGSGGNGSHTSSDKNKSGNNVEQGPVIIKAGQILFAVLDTAINSDYPDSPVLATVVDGEYKGSKLLGKIVTTKGVSGQLDRVSLNFTLMNRDQWNASKSITAFAIDPDTARSALASTVNYHYMQRFGAMFATSFLQGYAQAVTTSGSSSATTATGSFSSNPLLSPTQKIAVALGQVGQTLGAATQNYTNLPPTVKVDAGVSLGILFMADLSQ